MALFTRKTARKYGRLGGIASARKERSRFGRAPHGPRNRFFTATGGSTRRYGQRVDEADEKRFKPKYKKTKVRTTGRRADPRRYGDR